MTYEIKAIKNELQEANKKILIDTQVSASQIKSLLELKNERAKLELALKNIQREYSNEVSKMHDTLKLSDERFRKLEAKTLMDLDRERQHSAKIAIELKQVIMSGSKAQTAFNSQLSKNQKIINELRENIGLLKGQLKVSNQTIRSLKPKNSAVSKTRSVVQGE